MPDGGLAVHQLLDAEEVAARLPLDEVAGDRERPAAEADQRALRRELRAARVRTASSTGPNAPSGTRSRSTSAALATGSSTTGPTPSTSSTSIPIAEDGRHDVREEHRRVDAVPADRLERHLGAELRRAGELEERVALAQRAVLGQRAAGLAHEPDRRALDRLAPQRADEERLGHGLD